ncbi:hypothetical protein [uncultured Mucilaginibacter sp.]|uniref:hypothetical protein n=1 Tax=uncultured Mucilaginibacter sp. TaxID=797541 RepID=UPI0026246C01|nr:hypothetical protein [uncultured Mucilaginibacter sp.]
MEKLIIYVPERKSALVKELLKELGVTIEKEKMDMEAHLKEIANMPVWTDEDLKPIEEAREAFNSLKPA